MQKSITKIAFAGSGNIAWHLACSLKLHGYQITRIWSRTYSNAQSLAEKCNSEACTDITELSKDADLIIIAVSDTAIEEVASGIGNFDGIVVHTAGSVPIDVLSSHFKHFGVLYPLQTFTKGKELDLEEVPFFIEGSYPEVIQSITAVAATLSPKVYATDSEQRMLLHVAAVIGGNYSNFLYTVSNELIRRSGVPREVLNPLILETARKATTGDPLLMQTGPARRHDNSTIKKHLETLASLPDYAELYQLLARLISNKYK